MGTDEEIWADSASAKGNPCYVCLCYVAGKLSEELNFTEIFKTGQARPTTLVVVINRATHFKLSALPWIAALDAELYRTPWSLTGTSVARWVQNLAGQVRLELTLRRFGDERNCRYTTDL